MIQLDRAIWLRRIATAIAVGTMLAVTAQAETYPSRPIRLIVPYSAGSGADITARQTMAKLSEFLGQNVIVENRPGTSAIIGTDAVAKAAPDGDLRA